MQPILRPQQRRPSHHRQAWSGFTLLEPLLFTALLALAGAGSIALLMISNRSLLLAKSAGNLDAAIDTNLAQIKDLSDRYTCCAGSCTTTPPTSYDSTKSCATNNPLDDRYFFPQLDDPTTTSINEVSAVDSLCSSANNTAFLTPLLNAINSLAQPNGATRSTVIKPERLLQITYTATADASVARVVNLVPPMASFCP